MLIISPYFAPVNAADMQRVRMSLPYFADLGWDAEVVTVDERYTDVSKDELLSQTVPDNIKLHKLKPLDKKWTARIGLGSIAIRSLWFYKRTVDRLIKDGNYQLIYFSTTQFPVCILGHYWYKKFGVPYIIDMQDPWHSDYYLNKPKSERPPKYWFAYRLNKFMEPIAMKSVAGLISVSPNYITTLRERYPHLNDIPAATIPFGAFAPDTQLASENNDRFPELLSKDHINLVYIGRGGADMHKAIAPLFRHLQTRDISADKLKVYFIGTSYAPAGQGRPSILPLADQYGLSDNVIELTDRISYYHALITLQQADALFVPGSDDVKYSASKIYPYILTGKPLLAISNAKSPGYQILAEFVVDHNLGYDDRDVDNKISTFIDGLLAGNLSKPKYHTEAIQKYSAASMTQLQCELFNELLKTRRV
ncbi:glycosyltransferase family protein [Mucilaginibacter myungsuensis]|uniref:hypothetical protein n=1 Tax=Mucilaginibacter myungsuensis TaxID=649104 RepID=UPI0025B46D5F|nr:hypothetical protein [Mucilaginibacter myungsuensis]MDN3600884.1 hypothetical protein [Mucilaginibacter myungsuensis]